MGSASDEALVAGMAGGDTDAARLLVRRYQARVYGLAMAILHDRQAAEDVAQESFLRTWRHAGAFDPRRARVSTWLLTITRNAAIDAARMRRDTPTDPERFAAFGAADRRPTPDDAAVGAGDLDRVRRVLRQLPEEQRTALLHAILLGRTAREIAESEGIPLGTAKTRIRTGLRRLRDRLVDEEHLA